MKKRWLAALLIQTAVMLAVCAAQALSLGLGGALYDALLWVAVPLAGLLTAARAVIRGLNNYLAWIAPPVCLATAHAAVWLYAPAPGAVLLTALAALIGAAAGEVWRQRHPKKK